MTKGRGSATHQAKLVFDYRVTYTVEGREVGQAAGDRREVISEGTGQFAADHAQGLGSVAKDCRIAVRSAARVVNRLISGRQSSVIVSSTPKY